jgi:vacuolar-type H+-ATPase subunit I/STV1
MGDEVMYNGNRYIHESRVPISCGGTMEDTTKSLQEEIAILKNVIKSVHESQFAARDLMIAALEKRCEALDRIITQDTEREIALKQQNVDVAHLFNFKVEEASRYRKALEEIQVETYEVETEQRCAKALETKSGIHVCIVPPGAGDPICSICGRNTQGQGWGGKP